MTQTAELLADRDAMPRLDGHVMMIDEQTLRAESLAFALELAGATTAIFAGGPDDDLVRFVQAHPPQVALCSSTWPTATALVRRLSAGDVRTLGLGEALSCHQVGELIEAGAAGVVSTSAPMRELLRLVAETMAGRRVLSPSDQRAVLGELSLRRRREASSIAPFRQLSRREAEVLWALMSGKSPTTIAVESARSLTTIRSQIKGLQRKLGVASQLAAVSKAYRVGWTKDPSDEMPTAEVTAVSPQIGSDHPTPAQGPVERFAAD